MNGDAESIAAVNAITDKLTCGAPTQENNNPKYAPPNGNVYVVGSANLDLVVRTPSLPSPGETVLASSFVSRPGGKGANQATAAARRGAHAHLVARLGNDAQGSELRAALAEAGVDLEFVHTSEDRVSGIASITVTPDGQNRIIVYQGANSDLRRDDVSEASSSAESGAIWVSQLEIPLQTVAAVADAASRGRGRFVLNLAPFRPLDPTVIAVADPLVVNELEASQLSGQHIANVAQAITAAPLLARMARSVVITLGSAGAVLYSERCEHHVKHVPAPHVPVVDTTGAGDAFVGALAAALARGEELDIAVSEGVRVASRVVTGDGLRSFGRKAMT